MRFLTLVGRDVTDEHLDILQKHHLSLHVELERTSASLSALQKFEAAMPKRAILDVIPP